MVATIERVHNLPILGIESHEAQLPTITLVEPTYVDELNEIGKHLYGIVSVAEADHLAVTKESVHENSLRLMRIAEIATKHGLLEQAA